MPKGIHNKPLNLPLLSERFRFASDDDGHHYLIKAGQEQAFANWVAAAPYWDSYYGPDFEDCRINNPERYTFLNPIES